MLPVHVVIPTHLPRYLEFVLAGLARQSVRAATVIVSCDTDDRAIGERIGVWSGRLGLRVHWVRRPAVFVDGEKRERLCQVRNNAVRYLVRTLGRDDGRILILDGDTVASRTCVERHASADEDLVYPYRVDVPREQSESLDAWRLYLGEDSPVMSVADRRALERRDRRYRKHLLLRRFGLVERHKPKLLGGHFSVRTDLYVRLNGFDELYEGWGFKDDEFAERAARVGASVRVAVGEIVAWHLWHKTRQAGVPMTELPTYRRFRVRASLPTACERGIDNPLEQDEVQAAVIG